jgi:hypothetical protein
VRTNWATELAIFTAVVVEELAVAVELRTGASGQDEEYEEES